jgi:hypothetical protein
MTVTLAWSAFALAVPSSGAALYVDAARAVQSMDVAPVRVAPLTISASASPVTLGQIVNRSTPAALTSQTATGVVVTTASYSTGQVPTDGYVVSLIENAFPKSAWRAAEAVAWCESKFRTNDVGFNSNGTHDRGIFQLNDGGTQQYLFRMLGLNPDNLSLGFNPVLNVRAAALLYARDGWSPWTCASTLP